MLGYSRRAVVLGSVVLLLIQVGRRWLVRRVFSCESTNFSYPDGRLDRRSDRQRYLHYDVPVNVSIVVELSYLNDSIANYLEPQSMPSNNVSSHLCWAVGEQAAGTQVKAALSGTEIVIDTHRVNGNSGCSIMAANRTSDSGGEALFGDGFDVVLRIQLLQLVYISAGAILSQAEVQQVVNLGFKRGSGGRVAFRSLLHESPSFSTIVNVEAMSQVPTALLAVSPQGNPTRVPTLSPSALPSAVPSHRSPYSSSSLRPTRVSTTSPSILPSLTTTNVSDPNSDLTSSSVIFAAVFGGIFFMLFASFCFVFGRLPFHCFRNVQLIACSESAKNRTAECSNREAQDTEMHRSQSNPTRLGDGSSDAKSTGIQESLEVVETPDGSVFGNSINITVNYDSDSPMPVPPKERCGLHAATGNNSLTVNSILQPVHGFGDTHWQRNRQYVSPRLMGTSSSHVRGNCVRTRDEADFSNKTNCNNQASAGVVQGFDPFHDDEQALDDIDFSRNYFADNEKPRREFTPIPLEELSQPSVSSSKTPKVRNTKTQQRLTVNIVSQPEFNAYQDELNGDQKEDVTDMLIPWVQCGVDDETSVSTGLNSTPSMLRLVLGDARHLSVNPRTFIPSNTSDECAPTSLGTSGEREESNSTILEPLRCMEGNESNEPPLVIDEATLHYRRCSLSVSNRKSVATSQSAPSKGIVQISDTSMRPEMPLTNKSTGADFGKDHVTNFRIEDVGDRDSKFIATTSEFLMPRENALIPIDEASIDSVDTGNPWLFEAIEQTLGPRSSMADMETLSGRSSRSVRSNLSLRSRPPSKGSESSSNMATIGASQSGSAQDLQDLEYESIATFSQLKAPKVECLQLLERSDIERISTITASSTGLCDFAPDPVTYKTLVVPPGKLGVVLADHHDGRGTVISHLRLDSILVGKLLPGEKIVEIDGEDVSKKSVRHITESMALKASHQRRLTIMPQHVNADSV